MRAKMKTYVESWDADLEPVGSTPEIHPLEIGLGCLVVCEVVAPGSMEGRSLTVHITPDQYVPLMKELRRLAERERSKVMTQ